MKVIVRSLVIALAVTGAIASSFVTPAKATVATKTSAMPAPTCPPNAPNGCGLGSW